MKTLKRLLLGLWRILVEAEEIHAECTRRMVERR